MPPDPLDLAVRENATWCDVVCRSHRLRPGADAHRWWTERRAPSLHPDAITLDPSASEMDVLGPIHDAPGASVKDSFARLDLEPHGYRILLDATWHAAPPGRAAGEPTLEAITDKFHFTAWRHAWAGPDGVLLPALFRTAGVVILGGRTPEDRYDRGGILHRTTIGGTEVVGLTNTFGPVRPLVAEAAARFPDAWLVGYEREADRPEWESIGFDPVGPLRVWVRD